MNLKQPILRPWKDVEKCWEQMTYAPFVIDNSMTNCYDLRCWASNISLGTQVEIQEVNSNCQEKGSSSTVLTGDMGESYFSTKMDASRQGSAIPPCQFSHHVLYLLPQMSSDIKNEDLLSKQLSINSTYTLYRKTCTQTYLVNNAFNNIIWKIHSWFSKCCNDHLLDLAIKKVQHNIFSVAGCICCQIGYASSKQI